MLAGSLSNGWALVAKALVMLAILDKTSDTGLVAFIDFPANVQDVWLML